MNKEIEKIINDLIKKEARKEALDILEIASQDKIDEFLKYYSEGKENICCLVLDTIKIDLVDKGKMEMNDNDFFGHQLI